MIRLKNLLKEGRTDPIGKEEAEKFIGGVKDEIKYIPSVYRGKESGTEIGWIEPYKYTRQSQNTKNYYTLILDNSPSWSDFPDRSKSIVCTTDDNRASSYTGLGDSGILYRVITKPDTLFGICPEKDIFYSFPKLLKEFGFRNMDEFNRALEALYDVTVEEDKDVLPQKSWSAFKKEVNKIGESDVFVEVYEKSRDQIRNYKYQQYTSRQKGNMKTFADLFFPNYMTMIDMLQDLMDPWDNGFRLEKFRDVAFNSREVWTSGPALLVSTENELIEKINTS